jgi:hypothetical protein
MNHGEHGRHREYADTSQLKPWQKFKAGSNNSIFLWAVYAANNEKALDSYQSNTPPCSPWQEGARFLTRQTQ